jgi:hypothetical protein
MPRSSSAQSRWHKAIIVILGFNLWAAHGGTPVQAADGWIGTWSTAEVGRPLSPLPPALLLPPFMASQCPIPPTSAIVPPPGQSFAPLPFTHFANQTLRQIVHTSIGGPKARVLISNAYGTAPVMIGAAHIALRDKENAIQRTSGGGALNFSGRPTMTIPAGAIAYSDPVNLTVPAMADLVIDLYLPGNTSGATMFTVHNGAFQTNYVSETGNHVGEATLPVVTKIQNWFLLSRVEVAAPDATGAIVAFGDSITDGTRSTPRHQ